MTALLLMRSSATWCAGGTSDRAHLIRDHHDVPVCAYRQMGGWVPAPDDMPRCAACEAGADTVPIDDVIATTGATYRRLDYWARHGLLHPLNDGRGSGTRRRWPTVEVEVARRMVELLAAGLTLDAAHHAARNDGWLPGGLLRVVGGRSS